MGMKAIELAGVSTVVVERRTLGQNLKEICRQVAHADEGIFASDGGKLWEAMAKTVRDFRETNAGRVVTKAVTAGLVGGGLFTAATIAGAVNPILGMVTGATLLGITGLALARKHLDEEIIGPPESAAQLSRIAVTLGLAAVGGMLGMSGASPIKALAVGEVAGMTLAGAFQAIGALCDAHFHGDGNTGGDPQH